MNPPSEHFPSIIAIDGPAASGKSTLGKRLAEKLGYLYFDTGVMYRAVTWLALDNRLEITDEAGITRLAKEVDIDVRQPSIRDGRDYDVWVGLRDVTWEIRSPDVEANVSAVSAYPGVRQALSAQQRRIGLRGRVVMVGRDIGTVVLPEADIKIYLDASVEERARRRFLEASSRGGKLSFEEILEAMKARDRIDSTREIAPLRPADDAVLLDVSQMSIHEMTDQAMSLIAKKTVGEDQR